MRPNYPLVLTLLFSIGCGTTQSRLHYDATAYAHREVGKTHRPELVGQIKGIAQSRRLLHQSGLSKAVRVRPADVSTLPLVSLAAFAMFADDKFRGAEVDIRVKVRGHEPVPVSVYVGLEGAMRVHIPGEVERVRTIPVVDGNLANGPVRWDSSSRRAARIAFGLLSDAERNIVQTIPVSRYRAERGRENKGALYIQQGCQAEIRVYNLAFEGDSLLFSGRPDRPIPHSSRTMLHEIGHALHNAPARTAACIYLKRARSLSKKIERFNALVSRANRTKSSKDAATVRQLRGRIEREQEAVNRAGERAASMADRGPVLAAYERALDGQPAPTLYGEASLRESFAEAFSLFRADPAALRRVLPRAFSWFEGGGHVRAITAGETIGRAYRK